MPVDQRVYSRIEPECAIAMSRGRRRSEREIMRRLAGLDWIRLGGEGGGDGEIARGRGGRGRWRGQGGPGVL